MKCPTSLIIEQIGDRWKLHIIHQLAEGAQRTLSLLTNLKGISSRTLSAKLKALEADGWVSRRAYPEVPPRVEYELTEQGRGLMPLLAALKLTGEVMFGHSEIDCPSCQLVVFGQPVPQHRSPTSSSKPLTRSRERKSRSSVDEVVLL